MMANRSRAGDDPMVPGTSSADDVGRLVRLASVLGSPADSYPDIQVTVDGVAVAVELFRQHGVLLAPIPDREAWPAWAAAAADAVEHAPMPQAEWGPVIEVLGLDETAELLGAAPGSVRRYLAQERATPQAVAERLHLLALVIADLVGSYNAYGIRRWFRRVRSQLDGARPADLLTGAWDPDDEGPRRVRALAASLAGLGAT